MDNACTYHCSLLSLDNRKIGTFGPVVEDKSSWPRSVFDNDFAIKMNSSSFRSTATVKHLCVPHQFSISPNEIMLFALIEIDCQYVITTDFNQSTEHFRQSYVELYFSCVNDYFFPGYLRADFLFSCYLFQLVKSSKYTSQLLASGLTSFFDCSVRRLVY